MPSSHLVEPGTRYFLSSSLKHCKDYKYNYYNLILNIFLACIIILIVIIILYMSYHAKKDHITDTSSQNEYVLNIIKNYQIERQKERNELITNLPFDTSILM